MKNKTKTLLLIIASSITVAAVSLLWCISFKVINYDIGLGISSLLCGLAPIAWMSYIVYGTEKIDNEDT